MNRSVMMCAVALSLALVPSAAAARPVKIGFGGGTSVPVSDAGDVFKNGFHGKAMVQWEAPLVPVAVRASFGYAQLDLDALPPGVDGKGKFFSGLANVSYGFPVGPVKPYVIAGVGVFRLKTEVGGTSGPSETKFGIDAGAGLQFGLGGIAGFLEIKPENIFTDGTRTLIVPITFGVFF